MSLWPEIAAVLAACAAARYVGGDPVAHGFPLDDAWIHMVYGLGVVRDGSLAYNDGRPATGCTSPLWALVAGFAHLVVGARAPSTAAALALKTFGVTTHAATSALSARVARIATPRRAFAPLTAFGAGLTVATCPVLAYGAVSGMEVGLASALMLAALLFAARGRALSGGALAGLAFLARPEALVATVGVIAILCVGTAPRHPTRRVFFAAMGPLLAVAALVSRNLMVSGRPLPATFYAKASLPQARIVAQIRLEAGLGLLGAMAPTSSRFFWASLLVTGGVAAAVAVHIVARRFLDRPPLRRLTGPIFTSAAVGLCGLAYAIVSMSMVRIELPHDFYFQRYFAPSLPLFIVAAAIGARLACSVVATQIARARLLAHRDTLRGSLAALAVGVGSAQTLELSAWRARYASDVRDIDSVQVAIGHYVAASLPAGAAVWSMDAGAPRYWGGRRTVDLGRLNTPELLPANVVLPDWAASAIVVLDGPIRVSARDGLLELAAGFGKRPVANGTEGPKFNQVVWRCRVDSPGPRGPVTIEGYQEPLRGSCAKERQE